MSECRFSVAGEVDLATAAELLAKLIVVATVTTDDLVLDCSDLEFIDSMGVSVFERIKRMLEADNRRLRVVGMNGRARRPFEILGLTERLGIAEHDPASLIDPEDGYTKIRAGLSNGDQ